MRTTILDNESHLLLYSCILDIYYRLVLQNKHNILKTLIQEREDMIKEDLHTSTAKLCRREEGFIHVEIVPDVELSLADMEEIFTAEYALVCGKRVLLFIDVRQCKWTTTEAIKYWSDEKVRTFVTAVVFLISSPLHRVLGDFYITINKQSHPSILITTSEAEAIDWIKGFIK